MKSLLGAAIAAVAILLVAAGPAAARGGYENRCGDQESAMGAPWTNLKADNVSCRAARKLADVYVSADWDGEYKGWTCKDKQLGPEELKVKCTRPKHDGQRLKFFWGA
jgi:hypothetical protein